MLNDGTQTRQLLVFGGRGSVKFDKFDLLHRPLKREQFFSHLFKTVDDLSEP